VEIIMDAYKNIGQTEGRALGRLNKADLTYTVVMRTDEGGTVGLKPYYAIPFALLPRAFWSGKPLLGSMDGTPSGHLSFLTTVWKGGSWGTSVSIGPAGMPYWIAGLAGVVVIGFLGGLIVGVLWGTAIARFRPILLLVLFGMLDVTGTIYSDLSFLQGLQQKILLITVIYLPLTFMLGGHKRSTYYDYGLTG
jgi:hypothetical protein